MQLPLLAAGSSQALCHQPWMKLMVPLFICKCCTAGSKKKNLAEHPQEMVLGGEGKEWASLWKKGIHLPVMDFSRFLQGSCSKTAPVCWACSHCEKCGRGLKMLSSKVLQQTVTWASVVPCRPERDGEGAGRPRVKVCEGPKREPCGTEVYRVCPAPRVALHHRRLQGTGGSAREHTSNHCAQLTTTNRQTDLVLFFRDSSLSVLEAHLLPWEQ